MSTESYLILASWSVLGFVYFRFIFSRDKARRFGKSTVVWIGLLFLIFFTTLMWINQATEEMTAEVVENISEYYELRTGAGDPEETLATERYIVEQLRSVDRLQLRNSIIQMSFIVASLAIMFSLYTTMSRREKQMEVEKVAASKPGEYDAVLMDVQMPVMGGYEATRAIRALADPALAGIPIVAMTANAFSEDVRAAREAGMDAHVAKPIDTEKLLGTLADVLRSRRGQAGGGTE